MSKSKKVGIDERVPVRIRPADRDLIMEETFADPDLTERMRLAETRGSMLVVGYTLSELDDLLGHIAAAANHADDPELGARLDDLYDRLQVYEDRYEDDLSGEPPSGGDDVRGRLLEKVAELSETAAASEGEAMDPAVKEGVIALIRELPVDVTIEVAMRLLSSLGSAGEGSEGEDAWGSDSSGETPRDGERPAKPRPRLTLPEAVREEVEPLLQEYCDSRFPEEIRDELRLDYRIEGAAVVLFEERPAYQEPSRTLELPVAKFRYYAGLEEWRLLWRDRDNDWHFYDEVPPAKSLEPLLHEVDEDPTGIFWG